MLPQTKRSSGQRASRCHVERGAEPRRRYGRVAGPATAEARLEAPHRPERPDQHTCSQESSSFGGPNIGRPGRSKAFERVMPEGAALIDRLELGVAARESARPTDTVMASLAGVDRAHRFCLAPARSSAGDSKRERRCSEWRVEVQRRKVGSGWVAGTAAISSRELEQSSFELVALAAEPIDQVLIDAPGGDLRRLRRAGLACIDIHALDPGFSSRLGLRDPEHFRRGNRAKTTSHFPLRCRLHTPRQDCQGDSRRLAQRDRRDPRAVRA